MFKEFKEFAVKGNAIDLAIGVIIGAAFGKIVSSIVEDLIMPVLSLITGKLDFSNYFIALDGKSYETLAAAKEKTAVFAYGSFIMTVVDFLIIAFVVFLMVKQINRLKRKPAEEAAEPAEKECPYCFSKINIKATRCPSCTSDLN